MSAKERPILMSGAMVRACLAGTKTQTRRVMKKIPCQCSDFEPEEAPKVSPEGWQLEGHSGRWWCRCCTSNEDIVTCPYGKPGDRLWVRETWNTSERWNSLRPRDLPEGQLRIFYAADYNEEGLKICAPWRPSIFLPRWACRLVLEIVSVRVERLQDISEADALAEGIEEMVPPSGYYKDYAPPAENRNDPGYGMCSSAYDSYVTLWESINGPDSWAQNPWVWVVEFKRVLPA